VIHRNQLPGAQGIIMSSPRARPTIIVLAAGRARRFGADPKAGDSPRHKLVDGPPLDPHHPVPPAPHKLDQPLGASTVLGTTLNHALLSGLPIVVVTTPRLRALASSHVAARDVVTLDESDTHPGHGMGRSIAAGVHARPQASGWLVLPADMPLVRSHTLNQVADALHAHPVVYAQHRGQRGHPVGFSSELYSELAALQGDEGARRVIARFPSTPVDVDDPGVLMDIDTTDDLSLVRAYHAADAATNP
jgi:molybdenum cofactor cytidylyltransferase